jgi:transitional endoplasmic reticulum ATPase
MKTDTKTLKLKVSEALSKDVGRAYARMGPEDLARLGVEVGDIVEVAGKTKAVCKAMPAYKEMRGQSPDSTGWTHARECRGRTRRAGADTPD